MRDAKKKSGSRHLDPGAKVIGKKVIGKDGKPYPASRPTIDNPPRGPEWEKDEEETEPEVEESADPDADHEEGLRINAARGN